MPFSGYHAYLGTYDFWMVGLVGALGCLFGSMVAYYAGFYLGRKIIVKWGKYFFLREESIESAERWFKKYGDTTAFFSRLLPIIRTFISFPAGIGRMDVRKFAIYSFVGSLPWTYLLAYIGYRLGDSWMVIFDYGHYLDAIVIGSLIIVLVWFFLRSRKKAAMKDNEKMEPGNGNKREKAEKKEKCED
jgi:membrane protein DedA with SNARE-associated domain